MGLARNRGALGVVVTMVFVLLSGCTSSPESAQMSDARPAGWSQEVAQAIEGGEAERLKELLDSGEYDVNAVGENSGYLSVALTVAEQDLEKGLRLMDILIDAGLDLSIGARVGDEESNRWLPIPDIAVMIQEYEVARHLVAAGADVSQLQDDTVSVMLLEFAADEEAPYSISRALIAEDPNLSFNYRHSDGSRTSALTSAARGQKWELVHALLDLSTANAETVNVVDNRGTALMHASYAGELAVVEKLLANGADPNVTGYGDFTALILAVSQGHVEVAQTLLTAGADPDAANVNGELARDIAAGVGNPAMGALFDQR